MLCGSNQRSINRVVTKNKIVPQPGFTYLKVLAQHKQNTIYLSKHINIMEMATDVIPIPISNEAT